MIWFRKAADQGHARGQRLLGQCLLRGNGLPEDQEQGLALLRSAADQGYSYAQCDLGIYYLEGRYGLPQDDQKAFSLFSQTEQQEIPAGLYYLAQCYEQGRGTAPDAARALSLYRKSAQLGDEDAQEALKRLESSPAPPKRTGGVLGWFRRRRGQSE